MWIIYLLFLLFISFYIIFMGYIKIKMKFWSQQPVFHIYNLLYWLNPSGIINKEMPVINKYTNIIDIKSYGISEIKDTLLERLCHFIKIYYIQSSNTTYSPTKTNIIEYLKCCNHESYLTLYEKNKLLFEKGQVTNSISTDIVSVITARSMNITFKNKPAFTLYYVDNLCVHPDYRKHGIAQQMIETHYYNLRKNNKKIQVCLFKREGELNAIVPLVAYKTTGYNIKNISLFNTSSSSSFSQNQQYLNVIEIGSSQLSLLLDFVYSQKHNFDCIIMPDVSNIINMIKTENIYIYGVINGTYLSAVYVFRKPNLYYEREEALECIMSIDGFINNDNNHNNHNNDNNCNNSQNNNNSFITGFNISLNKIKEKLKTTILLVENTSNNNKIKYYLNNLFIIQKNDILFESPTAFFLYNYVSYSIPSEKLLMLY